MSRSMDERPLYLQLNFDEYALGNYEIDVSDGLHEADEGSGLLHYWSLHDGGTHFVLCDDSVRFLSYSIDHQTYLVLMLPNRAELIGQF